MICFETSQCALRKKLCLKKCHLSLCYFHVCLFSLVNLVILYCFPCLVFLGSIGCIWKEVHNLRAWAYECSKRPGWNHGETERVWTEVLSTWAKWEKVPFVFPLILPIYKMIYLPNGVTCIPVIIFHCSYLCSLEFEIFCRFWWLVFGALKE